jgi:hypothetical protein
MRVFLKNRWGFAAGLLFGLAALVVMASTQGDLNRWGVFLDGKNMRIASGNLTLTAGSINANAGTIVAGVKVVVYNTTTTARTITAAENGTLFVMQSTSDDPVTFILPTILRAGMKYGFLDYDATAAADLIVDPAVVNSINGQTDGVTLNCTGDAIGEAIWLVSIDGTRWATQTKTGTWTTGS